MADKKISQLSSASTPLAGTEVLPIVQSGSTVKVAVSDLTAGRAPSMTGATVTGLTASKPVFTDGSKALTSSGTVPTDQGGTGLTSFVANSVVYSSSTSALSASGGLRYNGTSFGVGSTDYGNAGTINVSVGVAGTTTGGLQLWSGTSSTHYVQFGDGTAGDGVYRGYIGYAHGTDTLELGAAAATRVSVTSAGNMSIANGNLVVGTAAKGIDFSANTHAAGMTSELLNWYEEGTWTPTLAGSSTAGTYELAIASGWYTRVGRSITVIFNVKLAAAVTGGGTGFAVLSGLPFNTAITAAAAGAVTLGGVNYTVTTNYVTVMPRSVGSAQLIFEEVNINGAVNDIAISAFGVNDTIQGTLTYIV